jgi:drug/metabolite transporter (DMT)-like permease
LQDCCCFRKQTVFRLPAKSFFLAAFVGALLMTGYVLQTIGLLTTSPAKSAFLTGLYIPLTPIFSSLVFRRPPLLQEIIGMVVAVIGTVLLSWPGERLTMTQGDWLTVGCAVAFAFHIVALGHLTPKVGLAPMTCWQILFGAGFAAIGAPIIEKPFWNPIPSTFVAIVVAGVLATAVAFAIQTWAQQHTSATRAALLFSLEPVFAWMVSFMFTGEVLTGRGALGAVLVLCGILCAEMKPASVPGHPS